MAFRCWLCKEVKAVKRENAGRLFYLTSLQTHKKHNIMKDCTIKVHNREDMLAMIKYYIRGLAIPEGYCIQCRLSWAAAPREDYYEMDGQLLAQVEPYPPMPLCKPTQK